MKYINGISLVLEKIAKWISIIAVGIMWIVSCYVVFMRYIVGNPPTWGDELCRYCLVWLSFYGASVAVRRGTLANMSILVNLIPEKPRKWFNLIVAIISFVLLVMFTIWAFQLLSNRSIQIQKSPAMGIPFPIVYSCLPIGLGLMAIQQLICVILEINKLIRGDIAEEVQAV